MTTALWLEAGFLITFVLLAAGILIWLRAVHYKLARITATADVLERQIRDAGVQLTAIAGPAAAAAQSVREQLQHTKPIFEAASRIGQSVEELTAAAGQISAALSHTAAKYVEQGGGKYRQQITEALDIAEAGYAAWHFWQSKRKEYQRSAACSRYDEGHDNHE